MLLTSVVQSLNSVRVWSKSVIDALVCINTKDLPVSEFYYSVKYKCSAIPSSEYEYEYK